MHVPVQVVTFCRHALSMADVEAHGHDEVLPDGKAPEGGGRHLQRAAHALHALLQQLRRQQPLRAAVPARAPVTPLAALVHMPMPVDVVLRSRKGDCALVGPRWRDLVVG